MIVAGSFRDPSGFVYLHDGCVYRQINECAARDFEHLTTSGLYDALTADRRLISHEETSSPIGRTDAWRTIRPQMLQYVSYPYEWSFSQLKDAALLTLDVQRTALQHGMTLKDASAYNVQFIGCRPIHIDTLSFTVLDVGSPWVAYRQFCQHFLGTLSLMAYGNPCFRHLLKGMIDGPPIGVVSQLLPRRTWFRWSLLAHIHLHARSQRQHENDANVQQRRASKKFSLPMHLAMVDSLERAVGTLQSQSMQTEWADYYAKTNYSDEAMRAKESIVQAMARALFVNEPAIHDIGANTGRFSRVLANEESFVISHDLDERAVETNYLNGREAGLESVLPLVLDINNPSPAIGWGLAERDSFLQRASGKAVVALALVHHIAITNNVPLPAIALLFAQFAQKLLIEFVPKEDSQVQRLLATREDIFPNYTINAFRDAFSSLYELRDEQAIPGTHRTLFAFERLPGATPARKSPDNNDPDLFKG